jgi:hypothetical protein
MPIPADRWGGIDDSTILRNNGDHIDMLKRLYAVFEDLMQFRPGHALAQTLRIRNPLRLDQVTGNGAQPAIRVPDVSDFQLDCAAR